jgi:hypothetical protein
MGYGTGEIKLHTRKHPHLTWCVVTVLCKKQKNPKTQTQVMNAFFFVFWHPQPQLPQSAVMDCKWTKPKGSVRKNCKDISNMA